jgi:hypothetical protein
MTKIHAVYKGPYANENLPLSYASNNLCYLRAVAINIIIK